MFNITVVVFSLVIGALAHKLYLEYKVTKYIMKVVLFVALNKEGVMKKSLLGLMLGIAFLFGNVQEASAIKGMQLKEICDWKNNPRRISRLPCLLFIQGVVYGFDMGTLTGSDNDRNATKKTMCIPKDKNQWTTIVKKYLEDHPEKLHEQGVSLIISSLATAFPSCYVEPDYITELEIEKSLDAPIELSLIHI